MSPAKAPCYPGTRYMRSELQDVEIICVEEHVTFPDLTREIPSSPAADHARSMLGNLIKDPRLASAVSEGTCTGSERLEAMNQGNIHMQVLSFGGSVNCTHMEPQPGFELAQKINNRLKEAVDEQPSRFRALAELPFQAPELAIQELRRCVKEFGFVGAMLAGSVGGTGQFLDAPEFQELLQEFENLDVPLYLHPGIPPKQVAEVYYDGVGSALGSAALGTIGWGWHQEVAIHVLRLAVSGTLDAHPRLKIIIGHQGEMMPMIMQRWDAALDKECLGLKRTVGEMIRSQVWIAISGFFSLPATQIAIQTWGVDRVLFANDYPYISTQAVPDFVRSLNDMVGPSDMRKILQTNAEELLKIKATD